MADISRLARVIGSVSRNQDLSSNTLVVQNLKINAGTAFYFTFSGSPTAARTISVPDANVDLGWISNLVTLSGVAGGSNDLGSFTGSTIPASSTIKAALQALQTSLESQLFSDGTFRIQNTADTSKKIAFSASAVNASTTRTISMPDADVNLADVNNSLLVTGTRSMAADLNLGSHKITNLANGTSTNDAVNYGQLSAIVAGLSYQEPIAVQNIISDSLTTPPALPTTHDSYLAAAGASGGWTAGHVYEYNGSSWIDVLGRAVQVGDRFGIAFYGATAGGGFATKELNIAQVTNATPGSYAYSFTAPVTNLAVYVNGQNAGDLGHLYYYNGSSWIDLLGSAVLRPYAGDALSYNGNTLNVQVDNSTVEISANAIQIKNDGVTASKIATSAVDGTTITGGGGLALSVISAPAVTKQVVAGQSFSANTTYLLRWGVPALSETAGRVYAADHDATTNDLFWIIGVFSSASPVSAGQTITMTVEGSYTLASGDSTFGSGDIGKPVWLGASGALLPNSSAPSSSGYASSKIGMAQSASLIWVSIQVMGVN